MKYIFATLVAFLFAQNAMASYPVKRESNPFSGSRFYVTNDAGKHTSIIMLHGSEGGSEYYIDSEANILAAQGYQVLVLCYFDCNRGLSDPRQTLADIKAESTLDAVAWLRSLPTSNGLVVIYGFSRGAELALLAGSLASTSSNRPDALIAHAPSDVVNGAWNWSWQSPMCWLCKAGIGKCPHGTPKSDYQWNPTCAGGDPNKMDRSLGAWTIGGLKTSQDDRIQIEKFDGPILITVGEKDEVWPAEQTKRIESTLKKSGRTPEIHYFPNGGHGLRGNDEIARRNLVLDFLKRVR